MVTVHLEVKALIGNLVVIVSLMKPEVACLKPGRSLSQDFAFLMAALLTL